MTTTERKALIDRDRKRHHAALAQLAASLGVKDADGLKLWRNLARIERKARQTATDLCNGVITQEQAELVGKVVANKVRRLFAGELPPRFRFNLDARGYALKLASYDSGTETATPFELYQDWGRNQILAPQID